MTNRLVASTGMVATLLLVNAVVASAQQGWSGTVTTISPPLSMAAGPLSAATHASGDTVLVWWQTGLVRSTRYVETEGAWMEPVVLGPGTGVFYAAPAVALDLMGNAVAVWTGTNQIVAARYQVATGVWGAVVSLGPAAFPSDPDVAMDQVGNAVVVWGDSGSIKVARYEVASHTWASAVEISGGYIPQIAMDPAGNAIVVSTRGTYAAGAVRAMHYSVHSGTWSALIDLAEITQVVNGPHIGLDADGNAVAMWVATAAGQPVVVQTAIFITAAQAWGAVTTLGAAAAPPPGSAALAVAATSHTVVAWSGPGGSVKVSHFSRSTGRWTSPADVSAAGVGAEVLDVEVDHAGRAIVVWIESDRRAHGARSAAAAARWTQPAAISPVGLTARYAQAGVDPSGNAIVVWGAAVQGCPPQCGGSIQGTRWLGSPAAPAVTTVAAAAAALTIGFVPPLSLDAGFDPTNYEYSTDDGASWTTRDPASTASPLVIRGLTAGTLYRSRLRAVNHAGIGVATSAVPARVGSGGDAPTGLVVTEVTQNRVTISWVPPDIGVVPTEYVLEGGIDPGQILATIPTGSLSSTFTFVAPTGAFYIRVHAVNGIVRSPASNEIRIFVNVLPPPSAPTNLLGLVNGSEIALSWTNTFSGGAPSSLWLNVTGALSTVLPLPMAEVFTYANVPPGTYTLSVVAANASGVSAPSNSVTLTFPSPCTGLPGTPTNLQAWKVGGTIFLSWTPPSGGPAVTGYTVWVSGAYVGSFRTAGRTLSGSAAPGRYVLSVTANNACGDGLPTPAQTVVIP